MLVGADAGVVVRRGVRAFVLVSVGVGMAAGVVVGGYAPAGVVVGAVVPMDMTVAVRRFACGPVQVRHVVVVVLVFLVQQHGEVAGVQARLLHAAHLYREPFHRQAVQRAATVMSPLMPEEHSKYSIRPTLSSFVRVPFRATPPRAQRRGLRGWLSLSLPASPPRTQGMARARERCRPSSDARGRCDQSGEMPRWLIRLAW